MVGRSMYKTKLCILYKRGRCTRPNCSFAHGNAELRPIPDAPYGGGRNSRIGDLRDKLDRRLSVGKRFSPVRDARGYHASRSLEKHRNRERRENRKWDGQGDYAESSKGTDRFDDRAKEGRNTFSNTKNMFEEELKKVQSDVDLLNNHKLQLGACIGEKAQEADSLISRIQELETQLDKEKLECKRINSSIKKFVKEYNRFLRAQDELKRSQARVQKVGIQLVADVNRSEGNEGDLNIDIVSDEKNVGCSTQHLRSLLQNNASLTKKRRRGNQDAIEEFVPADATLREDEEMATARPNKFSRWNLDPVRSHSENGVLALNKGYEASTKGDERQRRKILSANTSAAKVKASGSSIVVPSTNLSDHGFDDITELEDDKVDKTTVVTEGEGRTALERASVPSSVPSPPPEPENAPFQREGNETLDVDGL